MPIARRHLVLATLTIIAAVGVWQLHDVTRQAASLDDGSLIPKRPRITPEISRLQQYVRIDTSNPPGNELSGARWLAAVLAHNGIGAEIIESAPGRANVYARLRGRRAQEGLLLLSHIDVVPVDPKQWQQPPFGANVVLNMMWGRGTLDMKGVTLCELEAFVAAAHRGRSPERDIVFLATADEEQGSRYGLLWLLDHRPDVVAGVRYAVNEGGITETLKGELSYFGIEIGSKQVVSVELLARSRDALRHARKSLEPSLVSYEPDRLLPEVRRYFREIAPHRIEHRDLFANIDQAIAGGRFWLLPQGYRELLQNNIIAEGPVDRNGQWMMKMHLLNLPDELPDQRLSWLRSAVEPYSVTIGEIFRKNGPVPITTAETPFFALLEKETHRVYGPVSVGTVILNASFNDSRFLRTRGIDCYGISPFPVDLYQTKGIHGFNERIRLDWFQQGVNLTRNLVQSYAFGE